MAITVKLSLFAIAFCTLVGACNRSPASQKSTGSQASSQSRSDSAALAQARATVQSRYTSHFRAHQGFSVDTLRSRKDWFTPTFYQLLLADMSGGDIGIVEYDPFSDAQDDAQRFAVGEAHAGHDTVYVGVDVQFDSATESHRAVTLAMVRTGSNWQIGDFVDKNGSLVKQLRRYPPQAADTATSRDTSTH